MLPASLRLLTAVLALTGFIGCVHAKDAFVVLSGGGSPESNHYSQYLQARAYVTYLQAHYPENSIWVFFGAGNVSGQPAVLSDVEQSGKDEKGHDTITWLPGALPNNHPARHDVLARAFREEILPAVKDGGTLYLFVGDHGGPSGGNDPESIISLWSWDRDPTLKFGWRSYPGSETLGVAELRRWLAAGLGRGRVVFVMSQCYSGGFHYLGLPRQIALNPSWFTRVPGWVSAIDETKNLPLAAGFTATDDHSYASGCTSDVSADHWAGYERYLPENLLGLDLFTLQAGALPARHSFYEAHIQAVSMDQTIDKPRSTSEHYLQLWAQAIAHLDKEPDLKDSVKSALENFHQTLNGKAPSVNDAAFKSRQDEYRSYIERMLKDNPKLADLPQASQETLQRAFMPDDSGEMANEMANLARHVDNTSLDEAMGKNTEDDAIEEMQLGWGLWTRQIAPAWQKALDAGTIENLPAHVLAFEREMMRIENRNTSGSMHPNFDRSVRPNPKLLIYNYSGYADPATFDPARAKAITDWAKKRKVFILDWAKKSSDLRVRVAAEAFALWMPANLFDPDAETETAASGNQVLDKLEQAERVRGKRNDPSQRKTPKPSQLRRNVAAERIAFYRQVLAAWQFLIEVREQPALERVAALTQLERTVLPVSVDVAKSR